MNSAVAVNSASPEELRAVFMLNRFISEWIPKENAYFDKFDIKNAATIK